MSASLLHCHMQARGLHTSALFVRLWFAEVTGYYCCMADVENDFLKHLPNTCSLDDSCLNSQLHSILFYSEFGSVNRACLQTVYYNKNVA